MLEKLFRSRAEVAVLGIVLFTDGLHLREIARRAGVSPYGAKRELDNLVHVGILHSEKRGNQVLFSASPSCSFIDDLRNLFRKTEGLVSAIRAEVGKLGGIKYCFVYGSTATGRATDKSDIDLLIIGEAEESAIDRAILGLQKKSRREINFVFWSEKDFGRRLKQRSSFLGNITKRKYIWIAGDEDEFVRLAEKAFGGAD